MICKKIENIAPAFKEPGIQEGNVQDDQFFGHQSDDII